MTGSWRGWMAARPRKPSRRPRGTIAARPSRSDRSGYTDIAGGGSPAARAATTIRPRGQASPASSVTPRSRAQVGLAQPDAGAQPGVRSRSRSAASTPSAVSTSGCSATPGARGRRGDHGSPATPPSAAARPASPGSAGDRVEVRRVAGAPVDPHGTVVRRRRGTRRPRRGRRPCGPAATASSRSRITASAPVATALANRSGRSPGTYSQVSSIRPPRRRAAARSPPADSPSSPSTSSVSAPCRRPGEPDRARVSRTSGTARSASAARPGPRRAPRRRCPSAANCGSAEHVPHVVDRGDRRLRLLERGHHLVAGARRHPGADRLVELVGVRRPARARSRTTARPTRSGRPTRRITRSAMLCALVDTATQRPSAHRYVLRGALLLRAVAQPRLDVAELVVPGDLRAEHGHDRLDDRQVDDLARAGALARRQRQHDARTPSRARRPSRPARTAAASAGRPARRSPRRTRSSPRRACRSRAAGRTGRSGRTR